jgi:prolyl-tRNA synthetase
MDSDSQGGQLTALAVKATMGPMRYRRLFGKTLRSTPQDIKSEGLSLLVRGGFIRPLGHGLYSYLPLGIKVLEKLRLLIRREMELVGGQEVLVPLVNPAEIWNRSGRDKLIHSDMVRFSDRGGRRFLLSPSHEEAFVELVRHGLKSYRDFPALLYQFQRKYRDEERVRHGLLRLKEFEMKDAYSFHRSASDLNNFFPKMFASYQRIFSKCGLNVISAESGVGYMGGERAYEFLIPSGLGDDIIVECPKCGYRANRLVARGGKQYGKGLPRPLAEIATPGVQTMEELSAFLGQERTTLLKSMVYKTVDSYVMAVVRGDYEISQEKLSAFLGKPVIDFASPAELAALGLVPGYLSPLSAPDDLLIVVDDSVAGSVNLVAGGGKPDTHVENCNFGRDFGSEHVLDIAMAKSSDRCLQCGDTLKEFRAIELGNIFKLGDFYTRRMDLVFQEENGKSLFPHMGSYGIGMDRLIGTIAQELRDEHGLCWPPEIAPFRFYLMGIGKSHSVRREVDQLYEFISDDTLLDDRHESPGIKFKDSELLGIPWRIVISNSTIAEGRAELFDRRKLSKRLIPLADLRSRIARLREEQ